MNNVERIETKGTVTPLPITAAQVNERYEDDSGEMSADAFARVGHVLAAIRAARFACPGNDEAAEWLDRAERYAMDLRETIDVWAGVEMMGHAERIDAQRRAAVGLSAAE